MLRICGIDEVGRGPLAGPVVVAAVVFAQGYFHPQIKDSKKLSAAKRDYLSEVIKKEALQWCVVSVGHHRIDKLNILRATHLAMTLVARKVQADLYLIDGNMTVTTPGPCRAVVGGDNLHVEISAASIIAKVYRDRLMSVLGEKYPGYGFEKHCGYPTPDHLQALVAQGPSAVHRKSFAPVKKAWACIAGKTPGQIRRVDSQVVSNY